MKKLLSLIAAIVATPLLLYGLVSLDAGATHAGLRAAGPPALIPVRTLFAPDNSRWDYRVSPAGHWLAWREADLREQRIQLARVRTPETPQIVTTEPVKEIFFLRDGRLGLHMKTGTRAVPPKTPDRANWARLAPRYRFPPLSTRTNPQGAYPWADVRGDRSEKVAVSLHRDGSVDIIHPVGASHAATALTPRGEMFLRIIKGNDTDVSWVIEASSETGGVHVVTRFPGQDFGDRLLVELRQPMGRMLGPHGDAEPDVPPSARSEPIWLEPGDGTRLTAFLTRPQTNSDPGPLPTVIVAGTGGAFAPPWRGDLTATFLANRGYVVLALNGSGAVHAMRTADAADNDRPAQGKPEDFIGAAKWLVAEGIADANAIAVMGHGVGGMLALAAMAREPDLFAAGIALSPVSDPVAQRAVPGQPGDPVGVLRAGFHVQRIARQLDALENDSGAGALELRSQLALAGGARGRVLIAHGTADEVVNVEQTQAYVARLDRAGASYEAHYFDGEGHIYRNWQTQVRLARQTERFLAHTLGGNNGRYDLVELAIKFL